MLPNYEFIVCSCIYNRTNSLKTYMESLLTPENRKHNFHIYLVLNFDELWPKHQAIDDTCHALNNVDWQSIGLTAREAKDWYDVLPTPNLGLSGYNLGLEIGKTLNYTPVLCMNDDVIVDKSIFKLLEYPTEVFRDKILTPIRQETIGAIGPCYDSKCVGCMVHQEYKPENKGYRWSDYLVGHAQLITPYALKKDFRYPANLCCGFGAYDVAQSMILLSLELNLLVNYEVYCTFPDNKESHFHNGLSNRWDKLNKPWKEMTQKLDKFQEKHKEKYGFNKWYFD